MENHCLTNEISYKLNYPKIQEDFFIFRFADEQWLAKKDDSLLDTLKHRLSGVLSVAYLRGKQFYCLFDAKKMSDPAGYLANEILPLLSELDPSGQITAKFVLPDARGKAATIDERHLLQLLLNALPNLALRAGEREPFNNLTGRLFFVVNSKKWSNSDYVGQYETLDLSLKHDDYPSLVIETDVKTFTNFILKKITSANGKQNDELRLFAIDPPSRTMRRIRWGQKDEFGKQCLFIHAQKTDKRAVIPLLQLDKFDAFEKSKCGVLFKLLNQVEKYLQFYFLEPLRLLPPDFQQLIKCSFKSEHEVKSKQRIREFFADQTVAIVDSVGDEGSIKCAEKIAATLRKDFKDISFEQVSSLLPDIPNFHIIHDVEFYKNGQPDPHQQVPDGYLVQHLTLEKLEKSDIGKQGLENLLKELCLKNDLLERRITLYDWSLAGEWGFFFYDKDSERSNLLTISEGGHLNFQSSPKDAPDISPTLKDLQTQWLNVDEKERKQAEGLVISPAGDLNLIWKTDLRIYPAFRYIGEELRGVQQEKNFIVTEVLQILEAFLVKEPRWRSDNKVQRFIDLLNSTGERINKKSLREMFVGNVPGTSKPRTANNFKKSFADFFRNQTGEPLANFLRDKENHSLFPLNINYYNTPNGQVNYYVGEILGTGKSLRASLSTSSNVRKVRALRGNLIFDQMLDLFNVTFVKHGDLTVLPFPFKYLREYRLKNQPAAVANSAAKH